MFGVILNLDFYFGHYCHIITLNTSIYLPTNGLFPLSVATLNMDVAPKWTLFSALGGISPTTSPNFDFKISIRVHEKTEMGLNVG